MTSAPECKPSLLVRANCDACGERPEVLHMPKTVHGWYCGECCPACTVAKIRSQKNQAPFP